MNQSKSKGKKNTFVTDVNVVGKNENMMNNLMLDEVRPKRKVREMDVNCLLIFFSI